MPMKYGNMATPIIVLPKRAPPKTRLRMPSKGHAQARAAERSEEVVDSDDDAGEANKCNQH